MKSTKTVWKFPLLLGDETKLEMPQLAEVVRVGSQGEAVMLWALVLPDAPKEERFFFVSGTVHPVEMSAAYIGSVTMGRFEWHVWER